jgi:two-component system cell cycle sensor histidine kinase/response regulator CckA
MSQTILVAEDDAMVRNILVKTLSLQNYDVLEADNAVEALQLSKGFDGIIHLLVADESLKTMRARELFEQLQQSRPNLKVLQISGHPLPTLEERRALIPGAEFLQKPFLPKRLVDKVSQMIESPDKAMTQAR